MTLAACRGDDPIYDRVQIEGHGFPGSDNVGSRRLIFLSVSAILPYPAILLGTWNSNRFLFLASQSSTNQHCRLDKAFLSPHGYFLGGNDAPGTKNADALPLCASPRTCVPVHAAGLLVDSADQPESERLRSRFFTTEKRIEASNMLATMTRA
jgi:hypothetical protein